MAPLASSWNSRVVGFFLLARDEKGRGTESGYASLPPSLDKGLDASSTFQVKRTSFKAGAVHRWRSPYHRNNVNIKLIKEAWTGRELRGVGFFKGRGENSS